MWLLTHGELVGQVVPRRPTISGNAVKKYSALNFVGIETINSPINATAMTHFRCLMFGLINFTEFRVKLVMLGIMVYLEGDDVEHEVTIKSSQTLGVSLDIPLSDFTNLVTWSYGQLIHGGPSSITLLC
jgi:hypothetical protein